MSPNNAGPGRSKALIPVEGQLPRSLAGPSVSTLLGDLLCDIYGGMEAKKLRSRCDNGSGDGSSNSNNSSFQERNFYSDGGCGTKKNGAAIFRWMSKDADSLKSEKKKLEKRIVDEGKQLVKHLRKKNFLLMKREAHCDLITAYIQALSKKTRQDTRMKFSLSPGAETGFSQWLDAMKMVAQLPDGMPSEFRTKLWLQLSEKHLNDLNVDWEKAEGLIFNEWTNPDDEELGVQIVKDLHRTGCSLFCGEQEQNQALLKRVLLAYARWNKNVGYCQGFNMLAALILQVMEKDEKSAVKVMIYLIEGVLPESYFANNLRGLSVDMAVFRDLLRLRLPKLSKHLEALQHDTNSGTSYEPPLTNVFTMQWFLTLFSNCLPQQTVLRVWDLVFLYGNEVLLRTALAIWSILQDRVISVESADEFYSIMGVVTREMLEFGLMDANTLVKTIAKVDPFPNELQELRDRYLYNISPWTQSVQSAARKGIKLFYSDVEDQDDTEDEDKIALTAAYGVFRRRESTGRELQVSGPTLDISILKQQYVKLRQRQRQAHVIITAACASNLSEHITAGPSVSVNHLLMGKSALVNKGRRIGPPEGSIPPPVGRKGPSQDRIKTSDDYGDRDMRLDTDKNLLADQKNRRTEKGGNKTEGNRERRIDEHPVAAGAVEVEEKKKNRGRSSNSSSSDSSKSSTSTELCDEIWRVGSDSEDVDDDCECNLSSKRLSFGSQASLRSPTHLEPHSKAKAVCDNSNLLEIKMVAKMLLDDIEERVRISENLQNRSVKAEERKALEMSGVQIDNTLKTVKYSQEETDNFSICCDNIFKFKPEVPMNENVIEEGMPIQERKCKKSDLGLNIIRENLKVLHKYSALRAAERETLSVDERPVSCDKSGSGNDVTYADDGKEKKQGVSGFDGTNKVEVVRTRKDGKEERGSDLDEGDSKTNSAVSGKLGRIAEEGVTSSRSNVRLEKARSPNASPAKVEKVNKEVNTEISFGAKKLMIGSENDGFSGQVKANPKDPKETSGRASPLTRQRMYDGGHADEMKTRIEISKTDWDLKMRKIAELESTTRETLTEMRKWSSQAVDSAPVRAAEASDRARSSACSLAVPRVQGTRGSAWRPQLSFDAVTSRTEKLLGNVEFSRSTDDSLSSSYSFREFEYREPQRSVSDMKSRPREEGTFDRIRGTGSDVWAMCRSPIAGTDQARDGKDYSPAPFIQVPVETGRNFEGEPELRGSDKSPFNPFPKRSLPRPKNLGMRLGLYPSSFEEQPKKS